MVAKHSGADFACDVCGKRFGNRPLLMIHRWDFHKVFATFFFI